MNIEDASFTLQGDSVELVPMELSHLDGLWKAAMPEEIWDFTASKIRSKEQMEKMIKDALAEKEKGNQFPFVVLHKQDNKIVGSTRYLDISKANKSLEIGWTWYNPEVWRTRVNTECKHLLLQYAFEEWGMNRVQFKTDGRNVRSQRAIERLGAKKEGILRQDRILPDGYIRDTVVYSIIQDEWTLIHNKLLQLLER